MLLLIYVDTISRAEASFHPIPAAVTKGVQPDPKLNHNDNVYQHTPVSYTHLTLPTTPYV